MADTENTPGVYYLRAPGKKLLVHSYIDEDYELADIAELFGLGQLTPDPDNAGSRLSLSRIDLRKMKVQADAESFDHPVGFIEMCLDIYRFAEELADDPLTLGSID